jgi:type II secretory pathway pseudopilin PulG
MVELLVVMVIVSILGGIIMMSFGGAKDTAADRQVILAATAYGKAIDSFRLDNGGRVPTAHGTSWPATAVAAGPVDVMSTPARPYLRGGVPEVIRTGQIQFLAFRPGAVTTDPASSIVYRSTSPTQYRIDVRSPNGTRCVITNGAPPASPPAC